MKQLILILLCAFGILGDAIAADAMAAPQPSAPVAAVAMPRRPWLDPANGKPFFPLGWFEWGQPSLEKAKASLDVMADAGANTVLSVGGWSDLDDHEMARKNTAQFKEYLDHAQRRAMKVVVQLSWVGDFEREDKAVLSRAKAWVEAACRHPALLGYQAYDEPECSHGGQSEKEVAARLQWVQAFVKMRTAIHEWDPNPHHLVQMVFNLIPHEGHSDTEWTLFLPATDSFQTDRYGINQQFPYFARGNNPPGIWGPLRIAWQISHAVSAIEKTHHRNPAPVLQGVGLSYFENGYHWRDPLYDETRYMAYASLTAGGWGVLHWIHNVSPPAVRQNVARLYKEVRQLAPAFEQSWQKPPFTLTQTHDRITRDWLKDRVPDISTLALEDDKNCYLIAVDNTDVFEDVTFRLKLPQLKDTQPRGATVLNEDWSREVKFDAETGEWIIPKHTMCFGDVNIWVIPKVARPDH
jgi:hypothetical protein